MFFHSKEKSDYLVAFLAVSLILYIWISTVWSIFIPWYNQENSNNVTWIAYLIVLHVMVLMILWSYISVSFTCPGYVPKDYHNTLATDRLKKLPECRKCSQVKPPRSHHCNHGCNKCILKMDHHCPWIANCVGLRNHGHFLRFLWYTLIGISCVVPLLAYRTWQLIVFSQFNPTRRIYEDVLPLSQTAVLLFNLILGMVLWMLLGMLLFNTLKNVISNCTSVEQLEVSSEGRRVGVENVIFPFNISLMSNLKIVLGPCVWLWPLPLPSTIQIDPYYNGLDYATVVGRDIDWPPVEYCSDSSCEVVSPSDLEQGSERREWSKSENDLRQPDGWRQRARRDSEGFVLPVSLPWHHKSNSHTNLNL